MTTAPAVQLRIAIALIGLAVVLNYVDRGAISVAAPLIKAELGLSNTDYGIIVSAFFWTYVPAQALAGWLADRVSVHRLLAAGVAIWAIATALMGLAGSMFTLILLRLAMGIGEGAAFPCGSKVIARVPDSQRGLANVALSGGIALGPLVGTLVGGALLAAYDWRIMFMVFGVGTLIWLLPWWRMRATVDAPADPDAAASLAPVVALRQLIATPQLWSSTLLHYCGSYALYFLIAWMPLWLTGVHGFSIGDMALLSAALYLLQFLGGLTGAALADAAIRRGRDPSIVLRRQVFACAVVCGSGLLLLPLANDTLAILACIVITGFGYGPMPNLLFRMGQGMAGPAVAGRWVGLQSGVGNLAGVTGPIITGLIVDSMGYGPAFVVTAAIMATGVMVFALTVPRLDQINWRAAA